jgi:hypothetical protein
MRVLGCAKAHPYNGPVRLKLSREREHQQIAFARRDHR